MNRDDVAVFDSKIVSDNSIHPSASIIKVVIGQDDQYRILSLLALDEHRVPAEQLERLHSVVRESDDGVVIVDGIGDTGSS